MPNVDIEGLREILEKATSGNWMIKKIENEIGDVGYAIFVRKFEELPATWENCAFIADIHNNLPSILDELTRLRAAVSDYREMDNSDRPLEDAKDLAWNAANIAWRNYRDAIATKHNI